MKQFPDLPDGLWVVKWIDRFFSKAAPESSAVDVWLEKAETDDIKLLEAFRGKQVSSYLGMDPRCPSIERKVIRRNILAGNLSDVVAGDIHDAGGQRGRLYTDAARIHLGGQGSVRHVLCGDVIASRDLRWSANQAFRVLNRFEYRVPESAPLAHRPCIRDLWEEEEAGSFAGSRCLLIEQSGMQYIVPKIVIFRAFYGCCTRLINAMCNGPWDSTCGQVISHKTFKSKLITGMQPNGSWKVVLVAGMNWRTLGYPIALLYFDEYARACANHVYASARQQIAGDRSGVTGWCMDADIPFDLDKHELMLDVEGFALRSFDLDEQPNRFLVTLISGSTWPLSGQVLLAENELSFQKGVKPGYEKRDKPFEYGGRQTVEGEETAESEHGIGGDKKQSTNVFHRKPFVWGGIPKPMRQRKETSDSYLPSRKPLPGDPAKKVSAGNRGGGSGPKPAPAEVVTSIRSRSEQFDFLLKAVKDSCRDGLVMSYRVIPAPPGAEFMGIKRNELECWSLVDPERRRNPPRQTGRLGWDWIYSESGSLTPRLKRLGNPRCLLVIEINVGAKVLSLLEMECRRSESFTLIVVNTALSNLSVDGAERLTGTIRDRKGHPTAEELALAIGSMDSVRIAFPMHKYDYEDSAAGWVAKGLSLNFMRYVLLKAGLTGA